MKKIYPLSILFIILDIITKQIILNTMVEHQSISVIKNFFSITFAKNTGVAFSFLEGHVPIITIMTILVIIVILKYIQNTTLNKLETISYSLVLGGAIGNLIDRIIFGYVIDFLDFNIFGYSFPIFNLADTMIVIGIFTLLFLNIKESR